MRVAVPREKDAEALRTIVAESPLPVIADIHFNHTLALKAIDAGAHCIRLNPGNIGGREKVAEVAVKATEAGVPMRIGVNSGSLPKHLHELERSSPVEALVAAAVEFVELMEGLDFTEFKVSIKSTNVPNTIAANRLLAEIAREHHADYLDVYSLFVDPQGNPKSEYLQDDGIHLSGKGYEVWADEVERFLKK